MAEVTTQAPIHAEQFVSLEQQREAGRIGMWIFLATEIMFFSGLFTAFVYLQYRFPGGFSAGSRHTDFWLGSANTAVLLLSSLTMAMAVQAAKAGEQRLLERRLLGTILLGAVFLILKGVEYSRHIHEHLWPGPLFQADLGQVRGTELFFFLYFGMTGLHAIHMLAGILTLLVITVLARLAKFSREYHAPVELAGLYWHFVDIVWLFLFPMFYMYGGH